MSETKSRTIKATDEEWKIVSDAVVTIGFSPTTGRGKGIVQLSRRQLERDAKKKARAGK